MVFVGVGTEVSGMISLLTASSSSSSAAVAWLVTAVITVAEVTVATVPLPVGWVPFPVGWVVEVFGSRSAPSGPEVTSLATRSSTASRVLGLMLVALPDNTLHSHLSCREVSLSLSER